MFEALGDANIQQRIRDMNKGKTHCKWLMKSPNACECLPDNISTKKYIGKVCPNNPSEKHKDLMKEFEEVSIHGAYIFDVISYFEALLLTGISLDLSEMSPMEFSVLKAVAMSVKQKEMAVMGMSSPMSMFSGSEDKPKR